jgi:hypothetical protein
MKKLILLVSIRFLFAASTMMVLAIPAQPAMADTIPVLTMHAHPALACVGKGC